MMMPSKLALSITSGIVSFMGGVPYIKSILVKPKHGLRKSPAKASWLIWTLLDIITISGMYLKGASINGQLIMGSTNALIITILSLKYGESGWKKRDKYCLAGAFGGIVLWVLTSEPIFGIIISLGIMFIGAIPTLFGAWDDPTRENRLAWTLFAIASRSLETFSNRARRHTFLALSLLLSDYGLLCQD